MKTIKLKVQHQYDRNNLVSALANSGYKVWIEEKTDRIAETTYYVIFEIKK